MKKLRGKKLKEAWKITKDIREMVSDIAYSAEILSRSEFEASPALEKIGVSLSTALIEYEVELGQMGAHVYRVKK